jgi:hypothetical protein
MTIQLKLKPRNLITKKGSEVLKEKYFISSPFQLKSLFFWLFISFCKKTKTFFILIVFKIFMESSNLWLIQNKPQKITILN